MSVSTRGGLIVAIIIMSLGVLSFNGGCYGDGGGGGQGGGTWTSGGQMALDEPAPDFRASTIDGQSIELSSYIGEKHVVLDFWATWCGPCMRELPELQEFYAEHGDEVEIIAITKEGSSVAAKISQVVEEKGLQFPVIHDPSSGISNMYPTRSIPYLVFVNKDGVVIGTKIGYDPRTRIGQEIIHTFGL